jgi:hypothetical protein
MAPTSSAEFVAAMEDVLEVYARPADEARPLVCLDEPERSGDSLPQAARRAKRSDGNAQSNSPVKCARPRTLRRGVLRARTTNRSEAEIASRRLPEGRAKRGNTSATEQPRYFVR